MSCGGELSNILSYIICSLNECIHKELKGKCCTKKEAKIGWLFWVSLGQQLLCGFISNPSSHYSPLFCLVTTGICPHLSKCQVFCYMQENSKDDVGLAIVACRGKRDLSPNPEWGWEWKVVDIGVFRLWLIRRRTQMFSAFGGVSEHRVDALHDYWWTKCTDKSQLTICSCKRIQLNSSGTLKWNPKDLLRHQHPLCRLWKFFCFSWSDRTWQLKTLWEQQPLVWQLPDWEYEMSKPSKNPSPIEISISFFFREVIQVNSVPNHLVLLIRQTFRLFHIYLVWTFSYCYSAHTVDIRSLI